MRRIIIGLIMLCFPLWCGATTYLSDHFEQGADLVFTHAQASAITSEVAGSWEGLWCDGVTAAGINTANGHSGRGCYFTWHNGGGTTMEGALFRNSHSFAQTYPASLWIGYWFKSTIATGGPSGNDYQKLLRLYDGADASIIPIISYNSGEFVISIEDYHGLGSYPYSTGYTLPDNGWHYYIWQFTGASSADGEDAVIRLYVDGDLEYENTSVHFEGSTGHNQVTFTVMQGNLSGGWSGGAFTTSWDDFIVANTQAEVEAFLGLDEEPPAPAPPTLSNVTISGGSFR